MKPTERFLRLMKPPVWLLCLLILVCTASLICIFTAGADRHPLSAIAYALSFYTLTAAVIRIWVAAPAIMQTADRLIGRSSYARMLISNAEYRSRQSLYISLAANLLYAAVNAAMYFHQRSWWFVILAVYYAVLALMRWLLSRHADGERKAWRVIRGCSALLLTVNLVLSGAVLMILYQGKGFHYQGVLIYAAAAYTFYVTIHAIVSLVRYRTHSNPVVTMTKVIALCAALVSMLALETAMFAQFGQDMPMEAQRLMIILTGAGVSIVVIALSAAMLMRTHRALANANHPQKEQKRL